MRPFFANVPLPKGGEGRNVAAAPRFTKSQSHPELQQPMSDPYRMNLKGPWQYVWLIGPTPTEALITSPEILANSRVRMPAEWQASFGVVAGKLRLSRRFHRPTNLTDLDRVHIGFAGVGGSATISLNDQPIGGVRNNQQPVSFDVTSLLELSNVLTVELEYDPQHDGPRGGLWAPVSIDIHESDSE